MAWNPSPQVAAARDYGKKFKQKMVVILAVNEKGLSYASYGDTKALCSEAKVLADVAFDAIMEHYK